ncbi:MAG: exosortase system-associated protein, TIGR04073 family [Mariprofundaceae bacterium]|nr:exosortase system-associated protein, TIGR04073 family [Mariprofundaceae bacterium]
MFLHMRLMSFAALFATLFVIAMPAAMANDYGNQVVDKFSRGFANTLTGWVELPKNVVNVTKKQNIGMGLTVGLLKGIAHSVGRTVVGAVELVTFFVPNEQFVEPRYAWDFSKETTYGSP